MQKSTKFSIVISVAALLIIVGSFYVLKNSKNSSIQIISPKGGEAVVTGSTQTIKWTAENLPASNKISFSIRRIPPPPLQTEGQEFDPIIFINLPNTGSVDWTVSDMYPAGNYVLELTSYESIPVTNPITAESAQFTITKSPLVGNDRDAHGCIGSAGYLWCEAKASCIRPWETYCTTTTGKTVVFVCDLSKTITAMFYIGDDKFVDLDLSDGRKLSVPHAISGSGARYANADETFVFWNKGETAFITEGASSTPTFSNCILKAD